MLKICRYEENNSSFTTHHLTLHFAEERFLFQPSQVYFDNVVFAARYRFSKRQSSLRLVDIFTCITATVLGLFCSIFKEVG